MRGTAKLLLHVDINQTIMLADPAAGVGMKEGINIAIAKAAFGMLQLFDALYVYRRLFT
jgi:hypothetical protein